MMTKERKKYLDSLWINTDVGKWAIALAKGQDEKTDEIMNKIFEMHPRPYSFLMDEEKEVCKKIKAELSNKDEGKEYIQELEKESPELLDIMVAHEFSMLDLYYD